MKFKRKQLSNKKLLELHEALLRPRLIERKMLSLLRQGRISKWFSGIGQEAISVGLTAALKPEESIFTMHRNLGVFTTRNVPMQRLFCQWQGKMHGFTKGRDRSFHFGAPEYHIVGMISHLGPQLSLADGIALASKIGGTAQVAAALTGEGGTSQGEFHEALNVAAVWKLPVLFIVENNGYGLSTPTQEQYACKHLVDKAKGYGMKSERIDGNNVLEVYDTIQRIAKRMRKNPEPFLIECETFRMRGHEEASGTKYVPDELMSAWSEKDPLENYQAFLKEEELLNDEEIKQLEKSIKAEIEQQLKVAFDEPAVEADTQREMQDVYRPFIQKVSKPTSSTKPLRFVDAISEGLHTAMQQHPNLVLMGQDIAEYGGVFKVTEGFVADFGTERVRNTPLCESAIIGTALGLSLKGYKAMVEMQFADFVTCGFNQIINNLAKLHYRWDGSADVVIRMPTGGDVGAGPFHSQSNEAWFTHTPGLKVLYPSTPSDAKGLLLAAFEDPNPIMFFEHKALYRRIQEEVPEGYYTVEIGKARLARAGQQASIITYGAAVHWAEEAVKEMAVDVEILDLRSLQPLDYEAIAETVRKTNRVLLLHEDTLFGGIGGELAAHISEHLFEHLDAPIMRVASLDTPIPFAEALEQNFLPKQRLREQLEALLAY